MNVYILSMHNGSYSLVVFDEEGAKRTIESDTVWIDIPADDTQRPRVVGPRVQDIATMRSQRRSLRPVNPLPANWQFCLMVKP